MVSSWGKDLQYNKHGIFGLFTVSFYILLIMKTIIKFKRPLIMKECDFGTFLPSDTGNKKLIVFLLTNSQSLQNG